MGSVFSKAQYVTFIPGECAVLSQVILPLTSTKAEPYCNLNKDHLDIASDKKSEVI